METAETHGHMVPYRTLVRVWLTLLVITALLVIFSRLSRGGSAIWAMLVLTPIKAGLVFFFFMHLKYEKPYLKALVFLTLGLLTMVIGILFFDILQR